MCWFNQEFVLRKLVLQGRKSESSRRKTVLTFEMLRPDVWSLLNFDGFLLILSLSILLMWSVDQVKLSKISRRYVANFWSIMCAV